MKANSRRTFVYFILLFSLFFPTLFQIVSATNAMPTAETEGIVDGGLYQIRSESIEYMCLHYSAAYDEVWGGFYYFPSLESFQPSTSLHELFRIFYMGEGMYAIIPMSWRTNRLQANGDRPTVAPPNDSPEQRWYIIPCDGGYEIRSAVDEHPALCCPAEGYDPAYLSCTDENKVWSFEPMPELAEPANYIYVKVPAHWKPNLICIGAKIGCIWEGEVIMDAGQDGWYSFPAPGVDEVILKNANIKSDGAQSIPDFGTMVDIEPGKDCWIVVHDDPNIDGDMKLTVYDSKPENLPETVDPAALAPAAAALIVSALALLMSVKLKPKEL